MLISLRGQVQRLSRSVIRYQPEVTCDLTNRTPRRLMSRRNWRKLFRNMWAKARHWVTVALNSKSSVLASRNSIIRYLILGFMKWTIQVSCSTCFQVTECYNRFPLFYYSRWPSWILQNSCGRQNTAREIQVYRTPPKLAHSIWISPLSSRDRHQV